jgi:site-specific recombinase XerD
MKELGLPLDDIQQLMNHQWLGTTMVYTRTPTAALRRKLAERLRRARRRVR